VKDGKTAELTDDEIEVGMADLIDHRDLRPLECCTVGPLLVAGEIEKVLPWDDADPLDKAKLITPNGVKSHPEKLKARQDALIKAVLREGGFATIVLGDSHDEAAHEAARPAIPDSRNRADPGKDLAA
jgi:hypothetical protein